MSKQLDDDEKYLEGVLPPAVQDRHRRICLQFFSGGMFIGMILGLVVGLFVAGFF